MKKTFLFVLIFLVLAILLIYFAIPGRIHISTALKIAANRDAVFRKLSEPAAWKEWWPGTTTHKNIPEATYSLNNISYQPGHPKTLSVPVHISSQNIQAASEITIVASGVDSSTLHWEAVISSSRNPIKRFQQYLQSRKIKRDFSNALGAVEKLYTDIKHLYGFDIKKHTVVDSTLIFTSEETRGLPDYKRIYQLIDELRDYIHRNDANETGNPMLNIYTADSLNYIIKIAIPVNKKLPDSGKFRYRWMLGGGNILITEVRGGPGRIRQAHQQILHYIGDHQRIMPAISFESLVTNRLKTDTGAWITRIYYPVM
jgi:hypothetical protein